MKMYFRPDTQDEQTLIEIRDYCHLSIFSTDVCLDLGANIGAWTCLALSRGAKVVSVEPNKDNFSVLRVNAPQATLINAAVAGHKGEKTLNLSNLTTCHSTW